MSFNSYILDFCLRQDGSTDFEFLPYDVSLARCLRYCYSLFANQGGDNYLRYGISDCWNTTSVETYIYMPVTMRIRPSLTTTGTASDYALFSAGSVIACNTAPTMANANSPKITIINATVTAGLTAGRVAQLISNNNLNSYLILSAEL